MKVHGVTAEGNRVVFEFEDRGLLFGKPDQLVRIAGIILDPGKLDSGN